MKRYLLKAILIGIVPLSLWATAVVHFARKLLVGSPSDLAVFGAEWYLPHHSRTVLLLMLGLFVALAVMELLLELHRRSSERTPEFREALARQGEELLKRVRADLDPRLEPGEVLTGFHWRGVLGGGPGTVATETVILLGGFALIVFLPSMRATYGERAVVQSWVYLLVMAGGMLLYRTRAFLPVVWAGELTAIPFILGKVAPEVIPNWLVPAVAVPAAVLAIHELRRRGAGRLVVHTARRTFDYRLQSTGAPVLAASGPLPADVEDGAFNYCPLGESPSVPIGVERPMYLRPLVPFMLIGGVVFMTVFELFDLGLSLGVNVVPTIKGWNAGYVELVEFGCQTHLAMHPDDPVGLAFLADARCTQGRHGEAVVLLERARTSGIRPPGAGAGELSRRLTPYIGDHATVVAAVRGRQPAPATPAQQAAIEILIARELLESRGVHDLAAGHGPREALPHAREAVRLAPDDAAAHLLRAECAGYLWALQHPLAWKPRSEDQVLPGVRPWEAFRLEGRAALDAARSLLDRGAAATHLDPLPATAHDSPAERVHRLTLSPADRLKRAEIYLALGPQDGPKLADVIARTGIDILRGPAVEWRRVIVRGLLDGGCVDVAKRAHPLLVRDPELNKDALDGLKRDVENAK